MKKWLRTLAELALLFVVFVPLTGCGCSEDDQELVSGTYSAVGQGKGEVKVTITFKDNMIDQIEVDGKDETESIGGRAIPILIEQLKESNSPVIDGVSGATWTSDAVREAAREIFDEADIDYH